MTATPPSEEQHPVAAGNVRDKFKDFDRKAVFDETTREAASETCQNFVVEFGPRHARVARDLGADDFDSILENERGDEYPIRWINVWNTHAQPDVVEVIGERYDFSERLRALMKMRTPSSDKLQEETPLRRRHVAAGVQKTTPGGKVTSTESALERGEKALSSGSNTQSDQQLLEPRYDELGEDTKLYLLLKDTVNYFSIDHTDRALCIGAHWLYRRPPIPDVPVVKNKTRLMPPKHWMWLTMCNDNTVLSFHEEPTLEPAPAQIDQKEWELKNLESMRSNMLSVLTQISTRGFFKQGERTNPLTQSSIRKALQTLEDKKRPRATVPGTLHKYLAQEGASNLYYYLFEDYAAASPFQEARDTLNELTPIVLQSDQRKMKHKTFEIIPRLHKLSKELRELKHLFENYKNLIKKIMVTTKPDGATGDYPWNLPGRSSSILSFPGGPGEEPKVVLAKSAMDRFDRLADRLEWVVLNTIQGHLEEITALSDTYFNLTQQKDSQATAKLNRSATLLAKLSVFFLPISFMTGYFGVSIDDLSDYWTAETYWYAFAGVASISFFCLFFFGRLLMFVSDGLDDVGTKTGRLAKAGTKKVLRLPFRRRKAARDGDGSTKPDALDT